MISTSMILVAFFASGFNQGICTSNLPDYVLRAYVNNGPEEWKSAFDNQYLFSFVTITILIGFMIGSIIAPMLQAKLGYKNTFKVIPIFTIGFGIILAPVTNVVVLILFRILIGTTVSLINTLIVPWVSEISDPLKRGSTVTTFQISVCLGILLASVLNIMVAWCSNDDNNVSPDSYWSLGLIYIPSYLSALAAIYCGFKLEEPVVKGDNEALPWSQVFQRKHIKPIVNACLLGPAQNFTAINSVIFFASMSFGGLFSDFPKIQSAALGTLVIGVSNFVGPFITLFLIDRFGRKLIIYLGFAGVLVGLIILFIAYLPGVIDASADSNMITVVIGSVIHLISFEIGPGPVMFVYFGEIYPRKLKQRLNSIGFIFAWLANVVLVYVFPLFKQPNLPDEPSNQVYYAYLMYIILLGLSMAVLFWSLPETKGKTLDEIEAEILGSPDEENQDLI